MNKKFFPEDEWDKFRQGAQNRSNLFIRNPINNDYSNRNLKNESGSMNSMPSPKENPNSLLRETPNFTFQDHINEINMSFAENPQRKEFILNSSRVFFEKRDGDLKEIWKKQGFKIISLVFKFKNNLKQNTFNYVLKKSKTTQLQMIGDKTFFLDAYQEISRVLWQKKLEKFAQDQLKNALRPRLLKTRLVKGPKKLNFCHNCLQKMSEYVIFALFSLLSLLLKFINHMRPELRTRIFWDITLIIMLTKQMWYIPVFASFPISKESPHLNLYFQTVPLIIFSVDIFFNFVTGYYSKGLWVTEKARIAKHYLKKEFWIDILSLIPLYLAYYGALDELWAVGFMLRVVRISKMLRKIEDHFQLQLNYSSMLNLGKLAITLLFIVHIFSCLWNLIAKIEVYYEATSHTWLHEKGIDQEKWFIKYTASFYFALVTSVTVGYGDIVPQTSIERMFSCIIILFGCGQNAYSINSIGSIFQDMFKEEMALK